MPSFVLFVLLTAAGMWAVYKWRWPGIFLLLCAGLALAATDVGPPIIRVIQSGADAVWGWVVSRG